MAFDIIGQGVAFPIRVDRRGGLALVGGNDDVSEAITIILGTAPGERRTSHCCKARIVSRGSPPATLPSAAARISAVDADTCIPDTRSRDNAKRVAGAAWVTRLCR